MTGRTGIIAAGIAVIAFAIWFACGRSAVKEAVYPAENGRLWFSRTLGSRLSGLFHGARASAENLELRRQLASLRMVQDDVGRVAEENARLRSMLGLDGQTTVLSTNGWICAPVLSRGGGGGVRGLIRVGRGSADGVHPNAAVAVPDGLVGRVEQVSSHTADIRLIIDPSVKVSCLVETSDPQVGRLSGILEGGGARVAHSEADASVLYVIDPLRLRHLDRRLQLPPRARIVTSGMGGIFPSGLTIGHLIDGREIDETQLELEGDVVPAVDFRTLEDVFIRREN